MRKALYILAVIGGILAALGGLALALGIGLLAVSGGPGPAAAGLQLATLALAAALIGVGAGASLAWAGGHGLSGAPDAPLRLPAWGWWLLALLVVVAVGQVFLSAAAAPALWFLPPLHVLAGGLAALLFLAVAVSAARARGGSLPARAALASLAWGAVGGGTLAMLLELLLVLAAGLLAYLWLSASQPEVLQQLQDWALNQARNTGLQPDLDALLRLLASPATVLALLAGLGLAVPLIEETAKSLAVPLVALTGRRLTRLDGFLLGVAAGAGFTLLEGILNGSLALADPADWASAMLVRGGTAALHCLATGLAGLAWQAVLIERRGRRGLALALAAIAIHGTWNVAVTMRALPGLGGSNNILMLPALTAARVAAAGLMVLLWLAVVIALPVVAARLAGQEALSARPAAPAGELPQSGRGLPLAADHAADVDESAAGPWLPKA